MLLDSIMTERYVSSAYENGIMESFNEEVIRALQQISRKNKSYQTLIEVMHNQWYDVQASIHQSAKDQINKQMASTEK